MKVPLVDLGAQQREIDDEVWAGLKDVFSRTAFVGAPEVTAFEGEYAQFVGAQHCVGAANGTDALEMAMRAVGVSAGSEVVLPANTFIATAEAVARIGAVPVLVDVDPVHLLMDADAAAAAVTSRTSAIVPVHLFGQMPDMERIEAVATRHGIPLIEDAAQAQGASRNGRAAGAVGTIAATSFYPGKNLGAAGDAGAVTTNDAALAATVRAMGAHGSERKYVHDILGFNSRLDTVQAVVLSAKLRRLAGWNELRRQAADRYREMLAGIDGVRVPFADTGNVHIWHLYVVQVEDRDRVLADIQAEGVGAGIHYPTPVHLTGAFADLKLDRGAFPVAESACDRILSLPMYPHLTVDQQEHVVATLRKAVAGS